VRLGRIRGLGVTLISQRPAVVNKDVLSQVGALIALGMTGSHDIAAIEDWVRNHATLDEARTVTSSLAGMQVGEAWIWSPGWLNLLRLRVHHYPAADPTVERAARARLEVALAGDSVPDERTAALATLVTAARMEATLGLTGDGATRAHQRLEEIAEQAGFAPGGAVQASTVRPSVAFLFGVLYRAVRAALGPVRQ
jgi:hypothetical protein